MYLVVILVLLYLVWSYRAVSSFAQESPVVYILTRTAKRQKFFEECCKSVDSQRYTNWVHLVSCDEAASCEYSNVRQSPKRIIVPVVKQHRTDEMNCPYNLYFKKLMEFVPLGAWVIFLDDDGKMENRNSLGELVKVINTGGANLVLSRATGKVNGKPLCWGMTVSEIREKIKTDYHFAKIDTAHIAIRKTTSLKPWRYRCAGDAIFINDNIEEEAYGSVLYNDTPVISGNYEGYGSGTAEDMR